MFSEWVVTLSPSVAESKHARRINRQIVKRCIARTSQRTRKIGLPAHGKRAVVDHRARIRHRQGTEIRRALFVRPVARNICMVLDRDRTVDPVRHGAALRHLHGVSRKEGVFAFVREGRFLLHRERAAHRERCGLAANRRAVGEHAARGFGLREIVNYIDKKIMQQDIDTARTWQPDAIIACMHWGNEYQSLPSREQRQLADWLLEQGVTHIIGSHPHVIQPMELRTDTLTGTQHAIVYSLGNFISNMSNVNTDGGLVFTLELEKDTVTPSIPNIRTRHCGYNLVWTARPTLTKEKNYIIYPTDSTSVSKLPEAARNHLNIFVKNSRKLLQQHNVGIKENKK